MGAEQFFNVGKGATAEKAFWAAIEKANYDHGNSGYTGTLAEKSEFVMIGEAANLEHARAMAEKLLADNDDRIEDKWGPAGCIRITGTDEFYFFGWASS